MAYDDRYRINPAYLNQFRNMAYNDPWFALGEVATRAIGANWANKEHQKQLGKAEEIENALAREAYRKEAVESSKDSGLIGTSTYEGITNAKKDYGNHQAIYNDTIAKLGAFEGDKESAEYKNLLDLASQAQLGMQKASANAEMFRQMNRNMGLSNEGYYATDSLAEKLGDTSLLSPKNFRNDQSGEIHLQGGLLPMAQGNAGQNTTKDPTITEMAQKVLDHYNGKGNRAGILTEKDIANYTMANPSMKDTLVVNHEISKRDPQYFNNLRKELKKQGVSDEVIDEYIGGQRDNVAYGLLGDYYDSIGKGDFLDADATATQIGFFNPQLAQLLKTGGVSVNNLFGAQQNALNAERAAAAKAQQIQDTRKYNEKKRQQEREENKQDYLWKLNQKNSLDNNGGGSSGDGKASSEETYTKNLVFSAADALKANRIEDAEDFYYKAVTNLNEDITTAKKISAEARAKFRYDLLELEGRILWAKRARGEKIDEERYNEIQRELDELGG